MDRCSFEKEGIMEKERLILCGRLFLTFAKIGAFTFGGGYAMIPLIRREVALKQKWIEEKDILDILAVSESTPGPFAVNTATFVGQRMAGFWGALCATLGVVMPSFCIIFLLSAVLRRFQEVPMVQYAFWGVRVAVLSLVFSALISMYKQCPKNLFSYILAGAAFLAVTLLGTNAVVVLLACALTGLAAALMKGRGEEE